MTDQPPDPDAEAARKKARRREINRMFASSVPHNNALGITVEDLGEGWALFKVPYDARFVGNPETGVLHGGVITAMLDACSGSAVFSGLEQLQPIATLDLRIDYLRPAEVGRDVMARAVCYHRTRNVGFTRAVAYHDDEAEPIASAVGTFMIGTKGASWGKP